MKCDEVRELLEAAAIGALDPADDLQVQDHLSQCETCAVRFERLGGLADLLALSAPVVEPPDRMKKKLMSAVRSENRPRVLPFFQRPVFSRLTMLGMAATLVLSLVAGTYAINLSNELDQMQRANLALATELQGQDDLVQLIAYRPEMLGVMTASPAVPTARGRVYAASGHNTALFLVDYLPPTQPDRAYQVWLMQAGQPTSAGTFTVDANGQGKWLVHAPDNIRRYQAMTISEEPVGGSTAPTTPRIMTLVF